MSEKELCEKWFQIKENFNSSGTPLRNPFTNRPIGINGKVYKTIDNKCKKYEIPSTPPVRVSSPVRRVSSPVREQVRRVSSPVRIQSPVRRVDPPIRATSPVRRAPSPVRRAPSPVRRAPSPVRRAPSPVRRAPSPVRRAPSPVRRAPSPVRRAPSPVREPAQRVDPVVAQRVDPVVAQRVDPVVAQRVDPVVAQRVDPVVAQRVDPVVAQRVAPVELGRDYPKVIRGSDLPLDLIIVLNKFKENKSIDEVIEGYSNYVDMVNVNVFLQYLEKYLTFDQLISTIEKIEKMKEEISKPTLVISLGDFSHVFQRFESYGYMKARTAYVYGADYFSDDLKYRDKYVHTYMYKENERVPYGPNPIPKEENTLIQELSPLLQISPEVRYREMFIQGTLYQISPNEVLSFLLLKNLSLRGTISQARRRMARYLVNPGNYRSIYGTFFNDLVGSLNKGHVLGEGKFAIARTCYDPLINYNPPNERESPLQILDKKASEEVCLQGYLTDAVTLELLSEMPEREIIVLENKHCYNYDSLLSSIEAGFSLFDRQSERIVPSIPKDIYGSVLPAKSLRAIYNEARRRESKEITRKYPILTDLLNEGNLLERIIYLHRYYAELIKEYEKVDSNPRKDPDDEGASNRRDLLMKKAMDSVYTTFDIPNYGHRKYDFIPSTSGYNGSQAFISCLILSFIISKGYSSTLYEQNKSLSIRWEKNNKGCSVTPEAAPLVNPRDQCRKCYDHDVV